MYHVILRSMNLVYNKAFYIYIYIYIYIRTVACPEKLGGWGGGHSQYCWKWKMLNNNKDEININVF